MSDFGHWNSTEAVPEDALGFIYQITNLVSGRRYIGKKQMKSVKKLPPLKGKKNKRHKTVDTDWRTYTSSSNELNADIVSIGKDKFQFDIIRFCGSKSQLAYYEAKAQFDQDVLLSEDFYNGIINCRIGRIRI